MLLKEIENDKTEQLTGWICPKCQTSVAPHKDTCPECEHSKVGENNSVPQDKHVLMG
jgi:uncharacterized OB-fold protein